MKGWGRVSLSVGVCVFLAVGCGGRTGALGDDYMDPDGPGNAGSGGSASGRGGAGPGPGPGGGGKATGGAVGRAGSGPKPTGGYGGTGHSVGGYAGSVSFGGTVIGGAFPIGGTFPGGGFAGQSGDCQSCIFTRCGAELAQCFDDFGCIAIFGCMQATGCDTFQCYSPDTCGGVIDQFGGPAGVSMNMLLKAVSCSIQSGCPCP